LFEKDAEGNRRLYGDYSWFYKQPGNEHLVLFYEYFHGDTGRGLGASHQTGWTALVAELISEYGNKSESPPAGPCGEDRERRPKDRKTERPED
jgi:hypothetical protein